jgi:hypothetical protein
MASVETQVKEKCLAIIKSLEFAWPPASMVRCARLPWNVHGDGTVIAHPGITLYNLRPIFAAGTNRREDVGYGVGIAIIAPAEHSTTEMQDRVPSVREAIRRKLVEDRFDTMDLVSGATYIQTKIGDTEVNIPKEAHRYEVSGLAVRCWVREPRT